MSEPEEFQERHSRTVPYTVVISRSPKREMAQCRRREADERLWSSFTSDEVRAAEELALVWQYITNGLTAKAQRYERIDPGQDSAADLSVHLKNAYRAWRARLAPVERSACIAVLCESMTVRQVAKDYKRASAWPRANLGKCLGRWIEVRGWA